MSYKLVIKGGYGLTNFGDDALMYTLSLKLKNYFEEDEVSFACYYNKYNKLFSNGYHIESIENFKYIKTELLLFGGGTQFYSFLPKRSMVRIFLSKIKRFLLNPTSVLSKISQAKRKLGYKNIAAMGIGVGPFLEGSDLLAEKNAKEIFSQMSYVAVRDTYSLFKMREWKINQVKAYADICYLMDNTQYTFQKHTQVKKIGIVVRDWNNTAEGEAYYESIIPLVQKLEEQKYEVTLIIFAKKSDKFWNSNKKHFAKVLEWEPNTNTIEDFMKQLSFFDLILTARYHGAVFSTLLNIPFISIVVEQKLELISEIYKDSCEKWEYPFNINDCMEKIDRVNKNYSEIISNVHTTTIGQRKKATDMFNDFIDFCKEENIIDRENA